MKNPSIIMNQFLILSVVILNEYQALSKQINHLHIPVMQIERRMGQNLLSVALVRSKLAQVTRGIIPTLTHLLQLEATL